MYNFKMSSQLQWELIKKSSSFIVKDKKTGAAFSRVKHWVYYFYFCIFFVGAEQSEKLALLQAQWARE